MKSKVFYSFHFDKDIWRVGQVRNIGQIEGNVPIARSDWETLQRKGKAAVEQWIDTTMKDCVCAIVLIGEKTSERPFVNYEIKKAWESGLGLFGIRIHNLRDANSMKGIQGKNPFDDFTLNNGQEKLSSVVMTYDPRANNAYGYIAANLDSWVKTAIAQRSARARTK
jgi:hypothetical protein